MADLAFIAEELGVLVGEGRDLGFAGFEQGMGLVEIALLGEEEGEGAAEGASSSRNGLVADWDGLTEGGFGFLKPL